MTAQKIEWGEPVTHPQRRDWVETPGHIGVLHVATIRPDMSRKGGRWWVTVHLTPLTANLDAMLYASKASEQQAKATAQRVVNAFTKILNGDT